MAALEPQVYLTPDMAPATAQAQLESGRQEGTQGPRLARAGRVGQRGTWDGGDDAKIRGLYGRGRVPAEDLLRPLSSTTTVRRR